MVLTPEQLRHAQMVLLYMMKRIHAACVKRGVRYWLAGGTLIGAVRHKGFIPWDDDLDICMMRSDYDRMKEVVEQELADEFAWQDASTDPQAPFYFGKIRLKGTLWLEEMVQDTGMRENGFFVDVFPVDYRPESHWRARFLYNYTLWLARSYFFETVRRPFHSETFAKTLLFQAGRLLPRRFLYWLYRRATTAPSRYRKTSHCYEIGGTLHQDVPSETYEKFILMPFEDTEFYVPENWDLRLRVQFGDYMQMPPPEDRVCKHNIAKVDFGKY